ncbi:MAG: tail fiber domain-containing protein, partial [Halobacteriovoraceae bacterium]|nr:tail fiber domain-containing protein [Halobacteriovoraceae bacterium]
FENDANGVTSPTQDMPGLELIQDGNQNSGTQEYGMGIKFMAGDNAFTTEPEKFTAGIFPVATEAYSADTDGGTALHFMTTPNAPGASSIPNTNMILDQDGNLAVGGRVSLRETTAPTNTADFGKVYVKSSDSKLYFMDDAGTEFDLTIGSGLTSSQWTTTGSDIYYNTGNVGINTATPASELHVNGQVIIDDTSTSYGFPNIAIGADEAVGIERDGTNLNFISNSVRSISMVPSPGAVDPLFIRNQVGNIRIHSGNLTNGGISLESAGTSAINFATNANSGSPSQAKVLHTASSVNQLTLTGAATGNSVQIGSDGSDANVGISIMPKGTGNVGIGTTSPSAKLHIADTASDNVSMRFQDNDKNWFLSTSTSEGFGIYEDSTGSTPPLAIEVGGNVGIGITNPTQKLTVDGNINVTTGNDICIDGSGCLSSAVSGGGETNTGSNVGTGAGVYKDKSTATLRFRSLASSGSSLTVTENADDINLEVNSVGVDKITNGSGLYFTYQPNNTACTNGQVLKWITANTRWECADDTDTDTTYSAGNGIDSTALTGTSQIAVDLTAGTALSFNGVSGALESAWLLNSGDLYTSGNVGIGSGVSTPQWYDKSDSHLLHIKAANNNSVELNLEATGSSSANESMVNFVNNGTRVGYIKSQKSTTSAIDGRLTFATHDGATLSEKMRLNKNGELLLGASSANGSALLEIESTTKGFLPPRMTTAQRNAISSPAEGLIVFDTDLEYLFLYKGSTWKSLADDTDVSFNVKQTVAQYISAATWTKINWDTEAMDSNNSFSAGRFTPTVAGKYFFHSNMRSSSTGVIALAIYKNGVITYYGTNSGTTINDASVQVSTVLEANGTTDYFEVYYYVGSAQNTYVADSAANQFSGFLISGAGSGGGGGGSDDLGNHTATQNIILGSNYLSGDGGNEGIQIDSSGNVSFSNDTAFSGNVDFSSATIQDNSISINDVDFASSTTGINIPQLATAPGSPTAGQQYFNTTTNKVMVYDGSGWVDVAGNIGNNNSMVSGWPDYIVCTLSNPNYGKMVFPLMYANYPGSGLHYYRAIVGTPSVIDVVFNSDGTFNSYNGITASDCDSQTISQLYSANQAYNVAKGPAAQWLQNGSDAYYNAGVVGIGTSSPSESLEVVGSIKATAGTVWSSNGSTGTSRAFLLENYDDSATQNGVDFAAKLGGSEFQGLSWTQDSAWTSGSAAGDKDASLSFGVLKDNIATNAMVLSSEGHLGIGTTTPGSNLTVYDDDADAFISVQSESGYSAVIAEGNSNTDWQGGIYIARRARGTISSRSVPVLDDAVMSLSSDIWDGNSFENAGGIQTRVDGAVSDGITPLRIDFFTRDTAGSYSQKMTIKNNGNVGIGILNPTANLEVSSGSGSNKGIHVLSATDSNNPRVKLRTSNSNDHGMLELFDNTETVQVSLRSSADSFINGGNLGVGTSSPEANFEVQRNTASTEIAKFDDNTAANNLSDVVVEAFRPGVVLRDETTSSADWRIGVDLGDIVFSVDTDDDEAKDTSSHYDDLTNVLVLKDNGNVGIGTANPTQELHIEASDGGNLLLTRGGVDNVLLGDIGGDNDGGLILYDSTGTLQTLVRAVGNSYIQGGNVGIGTTAPDQKLSVNGNASKTGGTAWAVFSDARLKTVTGKYVRSLEALREIEPVFFHYNKDNPLGISDTDEQVGFVAQEVQKVIPEAVEEMESGYLQLQSDAIFWTMLNSIKELDEMFGEEHEARMAMFDSLQNIEKQVKENTRAIASLEEKVEELESENKDLKEQNAKLEERLMKIEKALGL